MKFSIGLPPLSVGRRREPGAQAPLRLRRALPVDGPDGIDGGIQVAAPFKSFRHRLSPIRGSKQASPALGPAAKAA